MATFDNIKVGDKVIYIPGWGNDAIATVTRVTPAGNFATDKTGKTLWDRYGHARGSDRWNTSHVIEYSEGHAKAIAESNIIHKAMNMMRKCEKSDLTVDQAMAIIDILNSEK